MNSKKILSFAIVAIVMCIISITLFCGVFYGEYRITRKQALYDYDAMWAVLEDNYPYFGAILYEYKESKYGKLDHQATKEHFRKELLNKTAFAGIDIQSFYKLLYNCLGVFKQIGHIGVVSPELYNIMQQVYSNNSSL